MPDIEKLIQKMKRQPNGIRFQELLKVLEYKGYSMKPKKRNIASTIYKCKRRCYYHQRRESIKGSIC